MQAGPFGCVTMACMGSPGWKDEPELIWKLPEKNHWGMLIAPHLLPVLSVLHELERLRILQAAVKAFYRWGLDINHYQTTASNLP